MYINTGYLNNSLVDFKDKTNPLIVGSCGKYRLSNNTKIPTFRPRGRIDYQIIYIASGKGYFHFNDINNDTIVDAGNIVLYRPKELQKYEYYGTDNPEVYWIHFTGSDVKKILRKIGLSDNEHVFYVGFSQNYTKIFDKIIIELQRKDLFHKEMLSTFLYQLFVFLYREMHTSTNIQNERLIQEMRHASIYLSENYNQPICIDDFASSIGMSVSYFTRNFKKYTGKTPMQYIIELRIGNAQMLLETSSYPISEIARIVGYDNPLYFSRLFCKQTGVSPSEYRKRGKA